MFGGAFLCYEALHKIAHRKDKAEEARQKKELKVESPEELKKLENKKVWGAIGTDTILSIEILAVALGAVGSAPLLTKALTLIAIGLAVVFGVYGTVALIVKMDDFGLRLQEAKSQAARKLGVLLVDAMPYVMRFLSFIGTAAMLLVGGGIALHGIPALEQGVVHYIESITSQPILSGLVSTVANLIAGVLYGLLAYPLFTGLTKAFKAVKSSFADHPKQNAASSPARA